MKVVGTFVLADGRARTATAVAVGLTAKRRPLLTGRYFDNLNKPVTNSDLNLLSISFGQQSFLCYQQLYGKVLR